MNRTARKVNTENLQQLAWKSNYRGVAGLARALGRHRTTVHRAVKNPGKFRETYSRIEKAIYDHQSKTP